MPTLNGQRDRLHILWRLAWPAIMEQILSTMVSYVDTAMVGTLGAEGTAAVSVNAAAIWLINGILMGVGVGYSVQVSNAVGARDPERVKLVIRQSLLAALACGGAACAVYEGLGGLIPRWLGAKPEVLPRAVNYMRIYAASLIFGAMLNVFSMVLRCMGNTKTPLFFNTAANLLNVVLNFFFIYPARQMWGVTIPGAGWGVEGAAAATAISIAFAGTGTALAAFRQGQYATSLKDGLRPNRAIIRRAVHLGLPSAAERATINLGQIATTALAAHQLTTAALAANQVATTAEGLCYLPAYGIGYAAIALVGQAVGAGSREDAKAYGSLTAGIGAALCLATGTALFLFASPLASLFNSDAQVVTDAALALRVVAYAEPFFALSIIFTNALRGAGDVRFPMLAGLCCMWAVRVPLACLLVLKLGFGLEGIWGAMAADLVLRGILCTLRWRRGEWMRICGLAEQ